MHFRSIISFKSILFVLFHYLFYFNTNALQNKKLPNFVLMLMDDMGWGDLGINGEPNHETPNLLKLASEGVLLPSMYSAAPICSPARASLLTGRLPVRNGFYTTNIHGRNSYTPQNIMGGISSDEILLPQLLKQKNYTNILIGKWHLGHREKYLPLRRGFDYYFGSTNCHFGPYDNKRMPNVPVFENNEMIGRYYEDFVITKTGESNFTQMLTQKAVSFLESKEAKEKPFFLMWTPDSSHAPTYSSEDYGNSSRRGRYGGSIMELDAGVGKIIETLKKENLHQNTFVVFTSDNGAALVSKLDGGSNGPFLCGKQTTFEGGMRIPGIIWSPNLIPKGIVSHQVWTHMDIFSTFLELAKIQIPNDRIIDGWPLLKTLLHPSLDIPRNVFYYRGDRLMAIRRGTYKMHLWTWHTTQDEINKGIDYCPGQRMDNITTTVPHNHTKQPILFNIEADPGEKYPLSPGTKEYNQAIFNLRREVNKHTSSLKFGEPQLNWCDVSVMHWSPPGCEKLNKCLPVPPSQPKLCVWPH